MKILVSGGAQLEGRVRDRGDVPGQLKLVEEEPGEVWIGKRWWVAAQPAFCIGNKL